ncbi:TonB-dependent receptor [Sphingomonas sp. R1]|uniref:TonB-dependent receptor n=1 Tax=Sphingomonas sp. R1 TaxID=399176 RepID=UPI0022245F4D|nr:TonB-dependent receptor [Sphingomonas sp. R1]UYY77088.1 TonB-dependent receptor [Sphingomonas sp. R1]
MGRRYGWMVAGLLAGIAPPALAQAQEAATPAAQSNDIVVTARFRNENLQDVPIAVSVVNGDAAASRNLNTLQDLSTVIPTVDFRNGQSNKDRTVFVRGVGTITTSPGVESSVSTVIDGVVLVRPGQATLDLLDLDHLEVLRGPQGTLFGKNASAGVINLVTKAPSKVQTETLEAGYYEGGEGRIKGSVSGPITSTIGYALSGLYASYKGNVFNVGTGHKVNGYDRWGVRGKIVARPNDDVTITFAGDYLYNRDNTPQGVYVSSSRVAFPTNVVTPNPTLAGLLTQEGTPPSANNKRVNTNFDAEVRDRNYGGSITLDWRLGGGYTLTSITAYREWRNHQTPDWDARAILATGFPQGRDDGRVDFDQFSQEIRLASPQGGLVDYVVGAYLLAADTDERYQRSVTQLIGGAPVTNNGVANYGIHAQNHALFGEANLHATDTLTFIAGGRLIHDSLSYFHQRVSDTATGVAGIRPSFASSGKTDRVDYSARAGVQYKLAPNANTYFTFSRGYKGPAYNVFFNMQAFDTEPLAPETSTSYEVGLKGSLFDGRFSGGIAAYLTNYDGFQANYADTYLGAIVTRLINAGSVQTKGVEADLNARPTDHLTLNFAVARTDAHIRHFNCPAATSCTSLDGQPLPFAPDWKLSGGAAWKLPITDGLAVELQTDASYKTKTQYAITQTPDTIQPAYGIWNASIALIGGERWELRALVKNILDQHYANYLVYGTTAGVARYVPRDNDRYVGLNARIRY